MTRVLADHTIRRHAQEVAADIAALPKATRVVGDIERIAVTKNTRVQTASRPRARPAQTATALSFLAHGIDSAG